MTKKEQESLIIDKKIFEILETFFMKDGLYNPYALRTKDGRFMDLYIEDMYTDRD